MWSITFTSSFLKSLDDLPKQVTNKFSEVMKTLETNPTFRNNNLINNISQWSEFSHV